MELRVRVVAARNLPPMDAVGKSDPYCRLELINQSEDGKTIAHPSGATRLMLKKVIDNSNEPIWNDEFVLNVTLYATQALELQMFDKDVDRDEKTGQIVFQLVRLPPGIPVEDWYPVQPVKGCLNPRQIHLVL
jgi:Ca2+-dependent lipid-binding protein